MTTDISAGTAARAGARDVSIVMPNWNGRALLAEFLPSVITAAEHYRQLSAAQVEIIVVDDAGQDDSVIWLAKHYATEVRVIARRDNGGFARAANSGFLAANYPIVLLLNNDIKLTVDAIAPLVRHFDNANCFGVCAKAFRLGSDLFDGAGKLGRFHKGHWRIFLSYDILPTRLPTTHQQLYSFVASGGYSAFDADKLRQLGGFCEIFSPFYWEDADLCYRAWKRGWQIDYEPESIVYHQSSATIGKRFSSSQVQVIAERNRLLMHWINLHDPVWCCAHLGWLLLKLLGATFTLDRGYWAAFIAAVRSIPRVLPLRRQEQALAKRSDREVEAIFNQLAQLDWVVVIRNPQDYYDYLELKRKLAAGSTSASTSTSTSSLETKQL